jgi:hypothetical protein
VVREGDSVTAAGPEYGRLDRILAAAAAAHLPDGDANLVASPLNDCWVDDGCTGGHRFDVHVAVQEAVDEPLTGYQVDRVAEAVGMSTERLRAMVAALEAECAALSDPLEALTHDYVSGMSGRCEQVLLRPPQRQTTRRGRSDLPAVRRLPHAPLAGVASGAAGRDRDVLRRADVRSRPAGPLRRVRHPEVRRPGLHRTPTPPWAARRLGRLGARDRPVTARQADCGEGHPDGTHRTADGCAWPEPLTVEDLVRLCESRIARPVPPRQVRVSIETLAEIKRYAATLGSPWPGRVWRGQVGDYTSVPVVLDPKLAPGTWEVDE